MTIYLYMGRRFNTSGRLLHFYHNPETQGAMGMRGPLVPAAKIGAQIDITFEGESFFTKGTKAPKIVGYMEDELLRSDWEAKSIADVNIYNLRQREKKMNRENPTPMERAIRTIQISLIDLPRAEKQAVVAYILGQLL